MKKALLLLEDGTSFWGVACGAEGETFGELCFNTALIGHPEILSDPSSAGLIITMTYPQIGNYGVARADLQGKALALRGVVVRDICYEPSNFRSELSVPDLLVEQGVVGIAEVDTRELTHSIRQKGSMRAAISTVDLNKTRLLKKLRASPSMREQNLVREVSVTKPQKFVYDSKPHAFIFGEPTSARYKVVAYDCGAQQGLLRKLCHTGCAIELVPWDTPAQEVLAKKPQGVFFSNGPGDPNSILAPSVAAQELLGKVPILGIGLGQQVIGKALGAQIERLAQGHHGGNQPVMNLLTHTVEITSQNHCFSVLFDSLGPLISKLAASETEHTSDLRFWIDKGVAPVVQHSEFGRIQLTHVNLNDGTPEGLKFLDIPALCLQYHPEIAPKPLLSPSVFSAFTRLMDKNKSPLDANAVKNRIRGGT